MLLLIMVSDWLVALCCKNKLKKRRLEEKKEIWDYQKNSSSCWSVSAIIAFNSSDSAV